MPSVVHASRPSARTPRTMSSTFSNAGPSLTSRHAAPLPTRMALRIVADRNLAYVSEAFAPLGDVVTLPSAELGREAVRDADLVLVRSTVKVGAPLLDGSRARFVATATIGTDHLDTAWLDAR